MRYVIVGAGSIGGVVAARLAQHNSQPPLVIARGANADAIRANGLLLRDPDGEVRVDAPVATGPDEVELTTDDVLVFATKTHQLLDALMQWVDRPVHDAAGVVVGTAGQRLPVLTALNGVEAERLALRLFARVYAVTVWLPAVHVEPGEFIVRIAPVSGVFIVGRHGAPSDETDAARDGELLDIVRADWERATFRVHPVDEVMPWKYRKLLSNLGNAVQALVGERSAAAHGAGAIYSAAREEGLAVYAAAGIGIPSDDEEDALRGDHFRIRPVPGVDGPLGGSTWQSLQRGSGSVETDYLNGEIVRLAREAGVPAPINEALQRLSRRAAAAGQKPGAVTGEELAAAVLPDGQRPA